MNKTTSDVLQIYHSKLAQILFVIMGIVASILPIRTPNFERTLYLLCSGWIHLNRQIVTAFTPKQSMNCDASGGYLEIGSDGDDAQDEDSYHIL
jgi:hypothetical protein